MLLPVAAGEPSLAIAVTDASQVGQVRRSVAEVCRSGGLEEADAGRASIVATEAATNLLKHARGGEILVRSLHRGEAAGIELLALDRGPGIPDVHAALSNGHSTVGTGGTGLGAMRRQSTVFDVYTHGGDGTAILSEVWSAAPPPAALEMAALCVAKPGESECGDAWSFEGRRGSARIVVADGLGHGPLAREAALTAIRAISESAGAARALEEAHAAARSTRGAAVAVAEVDLGAGEVRYAGFGNVAGVLLGPERVQNMVSMNGTAGQGVLKAREFTYRVAPDTLLVLSTDGLASHWSLEKHPGLARRHPALIAGMLYRDHSRRRDDVTVLVARLGAAS